MNPLTGLYGAGMSLRNALYDRGVLASRRLNKATIGVGNLSVGGSGKTPFVIALGELLFEHGIRYDVLSRGYRRKTHGVQVVEAGGTAAEFGDEALLITRRLKAPVIVGESRFQAGKLAEEKFHSQVHLLDDGFQHLSLQRDFDIVLVTAEDFSDCLLPSGRLREPISSLKRADAVVLPHDVPAEHPVLAGKRIWRMQRELALVGSPSNPVAFCGIARPAQFFASLRAAGVSPVAERVFRDHHPYGQSDIDSLRKIQRERGGNGFVTTEKDAVNLGLLLAELEPIAIAGLRLILEPAADIVDTILARIAERQPRS